MGRLSFNPSAFRLAKLSAAIFIVALFVRLVPLGLYVTPDEPIWVMRSVEFLHAIEAGDWGAVPQTGHPGITTMVLGALGVKVMGWLAPDVAMTHLDWISRMAWLAPENAEAFKHLVYFLSAGRVVVAVVTSLGLVLAYQLGRPRFGECASRWMALLLALDPFLAGYSGLLHTDALQATFALLAILVAVPRLVPDPASRIPGSRLRQTASLVLIALFVALSGLTKTLGLLVAPGLALAMLLWGRGTWWQRFGQVAIVATLTVVFLLALYPPFWVAPRAALDSLVGAVTYHEGIGLRSVFFLDEMRTDPGPAFYPLVLLFRMTPPVVLGLVAVLLRVSHARSDDRRLLRWGGLVALVYVLALTVATKKFDRYVLTVVPLLTPAAAVAWSRAKRDWRRATLGLLLLPWALVAIAPLHYATPLLGGPWIAQSVIPLGWGETSGFAARKVSRLLSEPETAILLTENVTGAAPFFPGETWSLTTSNVGCTDAIVGQRSHGFQGYVAADQLLFAGRELTTIYTAAPAESPDLPLLSAGPLPGLSTLVASEATTPEGLLAWLTGTVDLEGSFLWVHAPLCYPLAEGQIETLFATNKEAGRLTCESASPVAGFETEQCRWVGEMLAPEPHLARFAGAVDLVSAAWIEPAQALDPLTVHMRWLPHTRLGELEVYLALQTGDGAREITWADGGQRVINTWGWAAPEWTAAAVTDGVAYVAIPLDLPPGTYTLVMSLSNTDGWLGLTDGSGAFGGTQLILGDVVVAAPPYPASQLEGLSARSIDWPGVRVIGVNPPEAQLLAGRAMAFSLGLERTEGSVAAALAWELVCGGERSQGGVLPWGPTLPDLWPIGHRYQMNYAPLLASDLPEGVCTLSAWPVDGADLVSASTGSELPLAQNSEAEVAIVGEVAVQQRARSYAFPRRPGVPVSVEVGGFGELVGADVSASELRSGDDLEVSLYWRALGPAAADYTVFVHLVGSDGAVLTQSDSWPADGNAPTTTWSAGEALVDRHVLKVPEAAPAGDYQLYVGMYEAKHGTRQTLNALDARIDEDRAQLSLIEIYP